MLLNKVVLALDIRNTENLLHTESSIFFLNETCTEIINKHISLFIFHQKLYVHLFQVYVEIIFGIYAFFSLLTQRIIVFSS